MSTPIIAITVGRQNHYTPQRQVQTVTVGCDIDYTTAVMRAGGAPVLLPCVADRTAIRAVLEVADGVLLSGGGDIHAHAYGEEPHPLSKYQDHLRDEAEFLVTTEAMALGLPILGICRGLQVLNVALHGTLIQDVPSQVPGAIKHFSEGLDVVLLHHVDLEAGSQLAGVLQTDSLAVNSWHHQAIKEPGVGLRINCRARDGVIEGVEAADGRPVLAVQFHPEECAASYPQFQLLFDWLVVQAREARATPGARTSR